MSLGVGDLTRIIRASRQALGLDMFGRKKCAHMREDSICLKGTSSSGNCVLACSHYCTEAEHKPVTVQTDTCWLCDDCDTLYQIVCYLPTDSGDAKAIPIHHCPVCGRQLEEV